MKLTIEHLAAYLPYDLKLNCNNRIRTLSIHENTAKEVTVYAAFKSKYKPILHHLSDLTKEIEHNGENIIVADILFPINDYKDDFERDVSIKALTMENAIGHSCTFYSAIKILFKYHFDVFDLIEKNLAIDINTI